MSFTRIRDLDLEILSKLDDKDLGKLCSTNNYFKELCKNEDFWRNRTIRKFGKYLGSVQQMDEYRKEYGYNTWKLYYVNLVDFLYKINFLYKTLYSFADEIGVKRQRDEEILYNLVDEKESDFEEQILDHFNEYKWKEILKSDLVNPNKFFSYMFEINDDERIYFLEYLLNLNDERIDLNLALQDLMFVINENDEKDKLIVRRYLNDSRISFDKVIDSIVDFSFYSPEDVNLENASLNLFLDFIQLNNQVQKLKEKLENYDKANSETLEYIYKYLGIEDDVLAQIYNILKDEEMKPKYKKILKYIKQL